jgi:hypothetical protein
MVEKTPEQVAKEVVAWLESPEGRASLAESNKRTDETIALFRSNLTWQEWHELIHRPFTI